MQKVFSFHCSETKVWQIARYGQLKMPSGFWKHKSCYLACNVVQPEKNSNIVAKIVGSGDAATSDRK